MNFEGLGSFIDFLRERGELREITEPVSRDLEITEIADRVMKAGGPALLFRSVKESPFPLVINLFGSARRMAWALGVDDLRDKVRELEGLIQIPEPRTLVDKMKMLPFLLKLGNFIPTRSSSGPVKEVVEKENPDVLELPVMKCWPRDGGRYITFAQVVTVDPVKKKRNVGMYRIQVLDGRTCILHWQTQKVGRAHFGEYRRTNERMPVAVVLGGDPAEIFSAIAPMPPDIDEYLLAGFLRGAPVELTPCETIPLEVPSNAEIVIEGYIDPSEPQAMEGPFGDHTGYYSLEDRYPLFHVTAITRRRSPVYPSTIVGKPPMEDAWMGKAIERLFLPLVRLTLPEIVDMNLPVEGIFHNLALVSIRKRYPGHAQKIMHAIWGLGQLMFTKIIVVFDEDVNIQDPAEAVWRMGNLIDPQRDFTFVKGPLDTLNFASDLPDVGSKVGIDATRKWPEEGFTRPWPDEIRMSADVKQKIDGLWSRLGL
ncbi:menaquinone biosynthesis decarboxylase [bacterium]|nr:menaquinone biosynthesis decarboxylase [bacterium]